jgi:hypothetical protein
MSTFNALFSALFDVILAPFGHGLAWFDLLVWPVLAGVIALVVYKYVSNQAGITRAKNGIQVHLLEIVLYRDDLVGVLTSTAKALLQNALYLGYNIVPMLVMFVPMTAVLVQLVANYAYSPVPADEPVLLEVQLAPGEKATDLQVALPDGVAIDAGPVRTPTGKAVWRLVADEPGDYTITLTHAGETQEKHLAVGGEPRKVPVLRTNTWEAVLYPGEAALPSGSAFTSIRTKSPDRALPAFPDGEGGILLWFFGFSLAAGFALKDRFGVTL